MATAEYWQRGETLDYTNSTNATIPAGTIVSLGSRIGVAGGDIEPSKLGALHVCGVFEIAKTSSSAISMGDVVYFDGTGITGTSGTGTIEVGYAAAAAAASDTTVLVKLRG